MALRFGKLFSGTEKAQAKIVFVQGIKPVGDDKEEKLPP